MEGLNQLADEWRETLEYRFRRLYNYGPADPRFLGTFEIEMILDVVAEARERKAAEKRRQDTIAISNVGLGQRTIMAQTDQKAIDVFLEDAETGDPLASLAAAFPSIFGDEGGDLIEGIADGPPDDLDKMQVRDLLAELGLGDEE